ncbi:hypothetical protein HD806DRAFT_507357 [Xylariaceae sp. AK1471]|nr:hypothetical protein HD806DRAFT_507357 [Xylariaceae sp. AK1471]
MQKLLRPQTFPYADSSTGPYRGLLVRKYPCWDARGSARDIFTSEIAGKIKACLEQCLPESNSFVGFSLFMVGKLPKKTKPTIMIVSDDKSRRKEAFQIVKTRNLLTMYPGFELGHCSVAAEFEDLRQLGSDARSPKAESASAKDREDVQHLDDRNYPGDEILTSLSAGVCAFEWPNMTHPTRLYFHTSPNSHSHDSASATCGGLFKYEDELYSLTMNHAIHPTIPAIITPQQCESHDDSSSQSDDFEITGMDDWDEDDEGDTRTLTALTSPGSKTPSEVSDSEESLLKRYDSQRSSEISLRARVDMTPPIIYEDGCPLDYYEDEEDEVDVPSICKRVGAVVSVDQVLDIAVIKVASDRSTTDDSSACSLLDFSVTTIFDLDHNLTNPSITVKTIHHPEIKGHRSEMPYYTRLPGTGNFLELESVQLSIPLRPGDSGSWAFDGEGNLVGFVIAGSPKTGSCLMMPAGTALESMYSLLLNRKVPTTMETTNWVAGLLPLRTRLDVSRDLPDEDAMTVASSLAPPSIFSHRMGRSTPSTKAYSTITAPYEYNLRSPQPQEGLPQSEPESVSGLANKGDFWKDQSGRLRRELERAWEIIQEKDQNMQRFLVGDLAFSMEASTRESTPLPSADDWAYLRSSLQSSFGQGLAQEPSQTSPSELSSSQTTSRIYRGASPETPGLSIKSFSVPQGKRHQALKAEIDANRSLIEEMKMMWRTQVDANEALVYENKELRSGISQAVEAILQVRASGKEDDREGLINIVLDLDRVLRDSANYMPNPKPETEPEPELESNETIPTDVPPYSRSTRSQRLGITPAKRTPRRILTPKSRLTSPLSLPRGQSSMISESGRVINTVLEEDEDDDKNE